MESSAQDSTATAGEQKTDAIKRTPTDSTTGRQQYNFPALAPLPPPGQRPFAGARHGVHASVSGPIQTSPTKSMNGYPQRGAGMSPLRPPIPPFQQQQQLQGRASPQPDPYSFKPPPQPFQQQQQPQPQPQQPAPQQQQQQDDQLGALPNANANANRRPGRRQYARETSAYLAGEQGATSGGPAPGSGAPMGHAHTQSAFFSPASAAEPAANIGFPSSGGGSVPANAYPQPGQPAVQQQQQPQPQQPMAQMTSQFGQMGLNAPRPAHDTRTVNLVNLPLNPLELMTTMPPEINLPPTVRLHVVGYLERAS